MCLNSAAQPKFYSSTANFGMSSKCQIAPASDGGWLLITTYNYSLNMVRYDKCGLRRWAKNYTTTASITLSDICPIRSGGFAVTGYYGFYPSNCATYILRINDDGTVKFCKVYEAPTNEHIYSIGEDLKGNLLVDGNTESGGTDLGYNYILKTDSLGNYIWCWRYATGGYWGLGLVCSDNGLLRSQGLGQAYKIDEFGTLLWAKQGYSGFRYEAVELSDGYAYISYGTYKGTVVKLDFNGNHVWTSKDYVGLRGTGAVLKNIAKLPSDHVVASAGSFMIELDENGNYVRHNNLQNPDSLTSPAITDVFYMEDSSLLIAGKETTVFSARADLLLHTGCADVSLPADTMPMYPLTISNKSYAPDNKYFTISPLTMTVTNFDPEESIVCEIRDSLSFSVSDPGPICSGTSVGLNATTSSASMITWNWYTSSCEGIPAGTGNSITVAPPLTENYYVRAEGACDTTACDEVTVNVTPSPQASFEASYSFDCEGASMHLVNQSQNAADYLWTFSDGSSFSQENVDHPFDGSIPPLVTLIASNTSLCSDTMILQNNLFSVIDYLNAAVPNVFSPNNDGLNDEFRINSASDFNHCFSIKIFDRWGIELFSSDNMLYAWDGRTPAGLKASPGTYFYIVSIKDVKSAGQLTLVE